MPGLPWPRPADTGGSWTRRGNSSDFSTTRRLVRNVRYVNRHQIVKRENHESPNHIMRQTALPTTDESLLQAIVQLDPRSARAKQVVALVTIGVPTVGFAIAIYLMLTGRARRSLDYTLFLVFYAIHMFGITIGYHRYAAHKSFKTSPFFEGVLLISGSMAPGGPGAALGGYPPASSPVRRRARGPAFAAISAARRSRKVERPLVRPHSVDVERPGVTGHRLRARRAA